MQHWIPFKLCTVTETMFLAAALDDAIYDITNLMRMKEVNKETY